MKPCKALILLLSLLLFSCSLFFEGKHNCDSTSRQLTNEEKSLLNFNVNDSIVYTDQNSKMYYIKCTSKEYRRHADPGFDHSKTSVCFDYTMVWYSVTAEFKNNIPDTVTSSPLPIEMQISSRGDSATNKVVVHFFLQYGSKYYRQTNSPPLQYDKYFQYEVRSNKISYSGKGLNHVDQCEIQNKEFSDVYIFSDKKDTVYYNQDYGILKLVYNGNVYQFKERF